MVIHLLIGKVLFTIETGKQIVVMDCHLWTECHIQMAVSVDHICEH